MRVSKQRKTAFWGVVSSSLTLLLAACMPPAPTAPEAPKTTVSTLSDAAVNCEAVLRSQMLTKTLVFEPEPTNNSEIALVKASIPSMKEAKFSLQRVRGENSEIGASYSSTRDGSRATISYNISKASKDSSAVLILQIKAQLLTFGKSSTELSESFLVDSSCKPVLSKKSLEKITTLSQGHFLSSATTSYSDGKSDNKKTEFSVPGDGNLIDLAADGSDITKVPATGFIYVGGEALPYLRKDLGQKTVKAFGLVLNLRSFEISLSTGGKSLSISAGVDEKAGVETSVVGGSATWKLPESVWLQEKLGSSADLNSIIKSELPQGYLAQNASIILEATKAPSYEHFGAYWTTASATKDQATGVSSFKLVENPGASIEGATTSKDLESNNTIQTHLPIIEKLSKQFLAQAPSDRAAQVQLILNYLHSSYPYDTDMLKNNIIRPLTTSEALDRGKGVCQHYAVIFTALARAMGIPTRIIMGYLLTNEGAGAHAWNEVQIVPGTWRVIEPQSPRSLSKILLRQYLPAMHALNLENKDAVGIGQFADLINLDWVVKPTL